MLDGPTHEPCLWSLKSREINCGVIFFTHYTAIVPLCQTASATKYHICLALTTKAFFQRWNWGPLPNWILDLNLSIRFNHWRNWLDSKTTTLTWSAFFPFVTFFFFFSFWYHKETKVAYPIVQYHYMIRIYS